MKLTDPEIKAAKPKEKPYSLPDGHELVLLVQPSGAKWWRYRYRFNGIVKILSMGTYPEVTLKEARKHSNISRCFAAMRRNGILMYWNRQHRAFIFRYFSQCE